jgi:hypothetical protein
MKATLHPNHAFISSDDVEGTKVFGLDGNGIGTIDHLMIDKMTGNVVYAVMSFGGFLSLGHSHYPIPWSALTYDPQLDGFRTGVSEDQLRDAPAFSDDSYRSRDWETRVHEQYAAPPYWGV